MPIHSFLFLPHQSKKQLATSCGLAMFALALTLTSPAQAGFQWVAPPDATSYQPAEVISAPSPSPLATTAPEVISPVIISGTPTTNDPATLISAAPPAVSANPPIPLSVAPPSPTAPKNPEPLTLSSATIAMPAATATGGDIVQGFASQVPLALALRQILPVGYSFSIDQNIDMETLVSYKGGKSWRETLKDMLANAGLSAREQGSTVIIGKNAPAPVAASVSLPQLTVAQQPVPRMQNIESLVTRPSDIPMVNVGLADGWSAQRGDTLRKVLSDWCRRAGFELQWLAEYDYPLEASAHFNGDFEDAVRGLLAGFENARPQPVAELHANAAAGQKLLVIEARGNSYMN